MENNAPTLIPNLVAFGEMLRQVMEYQTRMQEDILRGQVQLHQDISNRDDFTADKRHRNDAPWPMFAAGEQDNVRLWTRQMEIALRVRSIAETERVDNAALCLKDRASQWFMSLPCHENGSPFDSWSDFQAAIIRRFEPVKFQHQLRDQLRNIKQ